MKRLDKVKSVINDTRKQIKDALDNVPIAKKESNQFASELVIKARDDIASSRDDYRSQRYANASEMLQQAVEKSAKCMGLLLGNLKPTDDYILKVGHDSFMAFVIDFWSSYPKVIRTFSEVFATLSNIESLDNFMFRKFARSVRQKSEDMKKSIAPVKDINREIEQLSELNEEEMWKASLKLDESNKWIKSSMNDIRSPTQIGDSMASLIEITQSIYGAVGLFDQDMIQRMKLSLALGKGGEKLFPLSLITCWHLEPARYPPLKSSRKKNYWRSDAYEANVPFIKELPTFIELSAKQIENLIVASNITGEILNKNSSVNR